MASSMLTAEVSASASTEADVDKASKAALHSCLNDPNFAIICDFLQKFAKDLGLDLPSFKLLVQWLTKTDEVSPQLRDMQIKLLRKTRKTVHEKSWESALSKFCFTYSAQDGWEIERFGYKNCSVKVKLRILRELLEYQFEQNTKFRAKILTLSADSLRSKPIGRDRQGHSYWLTVDNDCNIRIYQEHLDEEIWQVVATNRDEFVNLLKRLRGSEVVLPCKGVVVEDDDTTSSSSQIESDLSRKVIPPEEICDSQGNEQKVPKLSIKFVQGKNASKINNAKDLGKGEEELADEEDAKLLRKASNCSDIIESNEEEFEEMGEEFGDQSSEFESEDEVNEEKNMSKIYKTDQNFKTNLKLKDESKKVKPLLISQNKVIYNENGSTPSNSGKKRTLDKGEFSLQTRNENHLFATRKKYRPSLLDSKRTKSANKYEHNKGCEEMANEAVEVEEEIDEEDIDSAAAEEDENEEKIFEDYDDENEEEEAVGEEICEPVMHVTGNGSGNECNAENYLNLINFDLESDNVLTMSETIVEDFYYFYGEGSGNDSLVGNDKNDEIKVNLDEKYCLDKLKTEQKTETQSEKLLVEIKDKTTLCLENSGDLELCETSKKSPLNDDVLCDTRLPEHLAGKDAICAGNSEATNKKIDEEHITLKEEVNQINGEKKSTISSKSENFEKNESNESETRENQLDQNISETSDEKDIKIVNNNVTSNIDIPAGDASTEQINASKMFALESLKKELRESKRNLIEKKLSPVAEGCNITHSHPPIYNRKRRMTDQLQASAHRPSNSESEVEINSENTEDCRNDKELEIDESEQDIGGKRLKMRPKQAHTELRKKIEAQKCEANEETTSSSSGDEELRQRKKISSSKQTTCSPTLKSGEKSKKLDSRKDPVDNLPYIDIKSRSAGLTHQPPSLKQGAHIKHAKIKPSLAEIIEKKLKKAPEKDRSNTTPSDGDSTMEEATTAKELFPFPPKNRIIKPLKKNLLIQIRQEESQTPVRRKRTNSQDLNTSELSDKSSECTTKSSLNTKMSNTNIEKQKTLPERQRKRRSSEETLSSKEPELKKEVTAVKETVILKPDKSTETINQEVVQKEIKDIETNKESSLPVSSRRSGRRGGVAPTYVDSLHSKKNLAPTKSSTKTIVGDLTIKEESYKADVDNKSNGDKPPDDENDSKEDADIKKNINLLEIIKIDVSKSKSSSTSKTTAKGIRKQREVDTTNIIDIDSETPVRQSRRIAQQKIREEAERRKLEEIALRSMKQELKKKKKAEKQADPTVLPPTEPSSESEESNVEIKRKVQKKKCPGKNGNWSSGSEEQEEPEEEDEDHHHYETDLGSPLFKSDHEFSPESDIEDESQVVPMKRARTVRKEDAGGEAIAEEESCQKCKKSDHPEWILLCDNCDKGYHCSCLSPVLFYIPEGDWYCPPCQQEQLIKALESQLKEFDDLVENKRKLEEHEKRIADEEKARQEREMEANKDKTKKDKRFDAKRNIDSNADHSQEEDDNGDAFSNSDDSIGSNSKSPSRKNKNRINSRNFKNSDKRNHRDRRTNRARRSRVRKFGSDSDSDSQGTSKSNSLSRSNSSSSSTYSESDNEAIYKLRKRRQINVSYRLNEYDDLINSALKKEMDEVAGAGNLGRGKDISTIIEADKEEKARQKQIDGGDPDVNRNEEKNNEDDKHTNQDSLNVGLNEANKNDEKNEPIKNTEIDSDAEPIMHKFNIKPSQKKKSRKLTTLDISSEDDDGSDEDFKGSSIDDDEEEDTSISASNSDSSLEIYKRHGKSKKNRRKAARRAFRERRRVRRFLVDESDDEDAQRPKSKKKRKDDTDYTESDADDDDNSELSENIDSADLCDDTTTDESDGAWKPNKRKKAKKSITTVAQKSPKSKSSHSKKHKKVEYSDDDVSDSEEDDDDNEDVGSGKGMGKQPRSQPLKTSSTFSKAKGKGKEKPGKSKNNSSEDESSKSDSEDSTRRTRGRRYAYIEDFDDDSSDGGIKPGVQRPDTPPEEREKFIKRQEEIKRMLAEKNAEGAKLVATPRLTPIKTDAEKDKRSPAKTGGDSLSTVPLSVIRQAKVLDIDYLQRRGENLDDLSAEVGEVDDDFDDADLPDDLPEDMDEDTIARMVEEEEEFGVGAVRELPAPDEVLRTPTSAKPVKTKEAEKNVFPGNTSSQLQQNSQATSVTLPSPTSQLQEPVRKRLPMPTIHPPLLRHQFLLHDSIHNTHQMQRHGGALASSHLLQNALSAPLSQPLDRNYPPMTSSSPHHSIINRMTHTTPLQPTVSHTLSTVRPPHPPQPSINTKSSHFPNQQAQEKSSTPQNVTETKPRGRRKKITPLRDTLQKQQTAAAVTAANASSSALASTLVKNNDPASTSLLSNVIKSGLTQKLIMHTSGVTNVAPTSHAATIRASIPMPPIRSPYIRTDGPRFFDAVGNRISHTGGQRHRGPPQMSPSLLPPNPANRSSYGPPPPLKGSNSGSPLSSSSSSAPGSIRNPTHHLPSPYIGMAPNARHASHMNMYRPPIYGNPNFGPRVNLRPPNAHPPDFSSSSRAYPPYGFYPPPPPLTTPVQRPGLGPLPRSSTQIPHIQATHPSASVIVSATSSKSSNSKSATPQLAPSPTFERIDPNSSSKSVVVNQELQMKILPPKSPTQALAVETEEANKAALSVSEPRKKLTTLQAYSASTAKKSPMLLASDSSGSQSPHNLPTGISDESSAPEHLENTPIGDQPSGQEGQASEFSGLVSYFSSQHDDYNT